MAIHLHDKRIRLRTTLSILGLAAILFVSAGLHAQQSKQTSPPKHCLWLVETPLNNAILFKSFEGYPQIENRLLRRRNIQWVKKIEEMMAEDKNIFIIVGAGHLIGPGSVVALLKQKGYRVKQK